jgi:hypothetical protein
MEAETNRIYWIETLEIYLRTDFESGEGTFLPGGDSNWVGWHSTVGRLRFHGPCSSDRFDRDTTRGPPYIGGCPVLGPL